MQELMASWARLWQVDPLECEVEFSSRLRSSLGRARPGLIRLHPRLEADWRDLLPEVLCHEYAHLAAARLHGPRVRPHGPEWAELVRRAGFAPRRLFPVDEPRPRPRSVLHRCPVCQVVRPARTSRQLWQCAICRVAMVAE